VLCGLLASIAVGGAVLPEVAHGQAPDPGNAAASGAWTLDEALDHLKLFPRDAYVQYVALQLGRREGRLPEVVEAIGARNPRRELANARRGQIDLFSIFSGSLAVQESLQLDAMTVDELGVDGQPADQQAQTRRQGPRPIGAAATTAPADSVAVSELEGPTIKSHPWHEMLAGKTPKVTGLALKVPADFYFVSFRSANKLVEAADLTNLFGAHMFNQATKSAQTQLVNERLREQLAIEMNPALRPFYDAVIDEAAIVGSDLFVREGSDVTLLFHAKQPAVLKTQMDQFLQRAEASRDDAVRTTGQYLGVDWVHVATPDRRIHVYSAFPSADLHVRSNSKAALERVLATIVGDANGQPLERLGETEEFRYVRTLLEEGAPEEDGFIYLSDPFVRKLMGPALRLTERRRMVCYNHLRMIGHAGLMYRTQTGKAATSLAELATAGCAPAKFGEGKFTCPEHGEYTLGADGLTGVCSHHGYASYLTPCNEIETTHVTDAEAQAYRQFLEQYNSYWRQFFDPIAIRLSISPERYRAETIVLPLIDNSIYTGLARTLRGEPEPLDALPVPKRNIFSFAVRFDKEQLLRDWGMEHLLEMPEADALVEIQHAARAAESLKHVAMVMFNFHGKRLSFPAAASRDAQGRPLLSWRVHLLPLLDQGELYRKFHLNEPWDSAHNRALISQMPAIYRPDDPELAKAGKTRIVTPRGNFTAFPANGPATKLQNITDGSAMTFLVVEADDLHAPVWTKPDDLEIDLKEPMRGLKIREPGAFLAAMCNATVMFLRTETEAKDVAAMFTIRGEEQVDWIALRRTRLPEERRGGPISVDQEMFYKLGLGEFLMKGIGNQVGLHAYDADPLFDLSLARIVGLGAGMRGGIDDQFFMIAPLVGALNGPVYLSIPVKDGAVVDKFLDRLDVYLAELASQPQQTFFFSIDQDFYHLKLSDDRQVRGYGFSFGPLKWRFFWSRLGNGLYIASRREVIEDLAALDSDNAGRVADAADTTAHGLVRLRPQNWNLVLPAYQLAWEENNRQACLKNTGPLASLSRALASGRAEGAAVTAEELAGYTARLYDVHHFCPDGGEYHLTADGRTVACSVHNTMQSPVQTATPAESSELGRLTRELRDVRVSLTFLEDGLHAVATIEREPEGK
jgi:hypothetical protein